MQPVNVNKIKCPNCDYEFDPDVALSAQIEDHLRKEYAQKQVEKEQEYKQREEARQQEYEARERQIQEQKAEVEKQKANADAAIKKRIEEERERIIQEERKILQEKSGAYLKQVEEEKKVLFEEKLKREAETREKEMELIKLKDAVANQRQAIELELMQKFQADKGQLEENIRKSEQERVNMMLAEKEKQLDDQKKLIAEMQRKAEQGSMQMQGEVLELALEDLLKEAFPFDVIEEVGKGVRGADVIQTVRNKYSHECGKIIYETKRTKNFEHGWIEKLKHDMVGQKASVAVLVTEAYPKELDRFGIIDGVWICKFADIKPLVMLLRDTMEKIYTANSAQENKGEKMQLLYSYLTGNEFRLQIEAIVEGFKAMEDGLSSEKKAMQRIWKEREKQLEKVLTNTIDFYGSVRGIAGSSVPEIKMLELGNDDKLLEE
jgi:hypothetical protein